MCQMYAIFEEVVGPKPSSFGVKNLAKASDDEGQGISVNSSEQNVCKDHADVQTDASKSRSRRGSGKHQRIYSGGLYQQRLSSTLPRSGRRRLPSLSSSDVDDTESICSSNPLLDTISVLTYDPPDDSDDYYDLGESSDKNVKNGHREGDRDSIGYSGSSSIDSGYKSFCPTPDIPDPSIYGPESREQTQTFPGLYADSATSPQSRSGKPRIMMGTKVINRQGHVSPLRDSSGSRRSDSSLYDVNLDHLMYLRQSLLSAIQKCESSNPDTLFAHQSQRSDPIGDFSVNPVPDQCYTDDSGEKNSNPSYTKTVRFNTDVKVSTLNSLDNAIGQESKVCRNSDESNGPKIQSKSILKDPLCANLRSQLEAGSDCTLEEEIDSLLYGRAEFYDLENVDDFPCSYVTMIEDKYRSGKPSLAKVRKLKGGKTQEQTSKAEHTNEDTVALNANTGTEDPKEPVTAKEPTSATSSTVLISKQAKCRFTEVARCMLEIIEDLQTKKMQPTDTKEGSTTSSSGAHTSSTETAKSAETQQEISRISEPVTLSETYMPAAEYHVYEEIDYDFVNIPSSMKLEVPPPLPARPSVMFKKSDHSRKRAPSPPPRKSRCNTKKSVHISDGSCTEVRNRPKQRGNLYCLFSDRLERRNISRSLEREWRTSSDNNEDDYGFKREFPSI